MWNQINRNKVFIIVPAYNEQTVIQHVIDELEKLPYQIIVVDDGSDSALDDILQNRHVFLVRHSINLGQGAAIQTGIDFALSMNAEYIITFDGDGQHQAEDVDILLNNILKYKVDIILGSRFLSKPANGITKKRIALLSMARYVNFLFTGLFLSDAHNGLRCFTKTVAQRINLQQNRMAHATEFLSLARKNKFTYKEVPVTVHYTIYSKEKGQSFSSSFRIFLDLIINKLVQ